jgi:TonB family protein
MALALLTIQPGSSACRRVTMKIKALVTFALALALCSTLLAQEAKRTMKTQGKPSYPELAKRMNVAGSVKVEVVVAPNGTVKSAKALGGHPLLIDSALAAAKNTKYEPAAEETKELITYNFSNGN